MNSTTAATIRKFKDLEGRYIWTDALTAGQPPMLLGFPVELDESMPDLGANAYEDRPRGKGSAKFQINL